MRRVQTHFVVLLLSFWFGATIQCGLKAAGLLDSEVTCTMGGTPANEGCCVVEHDEYRGVNDTLKVPVPELFDDCCCIGLSATAAPDEKTAHSVEDAFVRPRDWVPVRHFVQRAALSPRAPSGLAA